VIGNAAWRRGLLVEADDAYRQALTLARQLGDQARTASLVGNLGGVALAQGVFEQAERLFEESVREGRSVGDLLACARALCNLGASAYRQGDRLRAQRRYREALQTLRELGEWQTVGTVVANFALLAADERDYERAARLFGAAERLFHRGGQPYPPFDAEASGHSRAERMARETLGKDRFTSVRAIGQTLTTDQAIALALSGNDSSQGKREEPLARLSRRERQVATLIAQGLTNREMAERLIIAERTADTHVQNILAKLGCASRKDVAALLTADLSRGPTPV